MVFHVQLGRYTHVLRLQLMLNKITWVCCNRIIIIICNIAHYVCNVFHKLLQVKKNIGMNFVYLKLDSSIPGRYFTVRVDVTAMDEISSLSSLFSLIFTYVLNNRSHLSEMLFLKGLLRSSILYLFFLIYLSKGMCVCFFQAHILNAYMHNGIVNFVKESSRIFF